MSAGAADAGARTAEPTGSNPATTSSPERIFFEGDSITARYDDVAGSARQGYWSLLADDLGLAPETDAQGDSGFVRPGQLHPHQRPRTLCDGTTFAQRLTPVVRAEITEARVVVIEGGKNDFHTCGPDGEDMLVPSEAISSAADDYLAQVASLRAGEDPATVFVITPWGMQRNAENRTRVIPLIRAAAQTQGFTFIGLGGVLDPDHERENTIDGIHPTRAGSIAIERAMVHRSDILSFGAAHP